MTTLPLQAPAAAPFISLLGGHALAHQPPPLDLRGCAIDVCNAWEKVKEPLKLQRNSRGLLRRSDVVRAARGLHSQVTVSAWGSERAEHPDMLAGRLAVVDWIAHAAAHLPKRLTVKTLGLLSRFLWGYLERTALYAVYFKARQANPGQAPARQAAEPTRKPGMCSIGFAYGAPTLSAFLPQGKGKKGRGKFSRIGLDDEFWQILAKNKEGNALLALTQAQAKQAQAQARRKEGDASSPAPVSIDEDTAQRLQALVDPLLQGQQGGPQFIVTRPRQPAMRLHLQLTREPGGSAKSLGDDPLAWRRSRYGLFDAIESMVLRNFVPHAQSLAKGQTDWGTFERLHWYLAPIDRTARRHAQIFTHSKTPKNHDSN